MVTSNCAKLIDQSGLLVDADDWAVAIRIVNTRRVFGRVDVLVTPVRGRGERWVSLDRIKLHPECPT